VGKAITAVAGSPCYNRIQRAFVQIRTAIDTANFELLDNAFNTCTPLASANQLDIWNFFDTVSHMMSGSVQYHRCDGSLLLKKKNKIIEFSFIQRNRNT
jgi:hypothetical protein